MRAQESGSAGQAAGSEAIEQAMAAKSAEFRAGGGQIYVPIRPEAPLPLAGEGQG